MHSNFEKIAKKPRRHGANESRQEAKRRDLERREARKAKRQEVPDECI